MRKILELAFQRGKKKFKSDGVSSPKWRVAAPVEIATYRKRSQISANCRLKWSVEMHLLQLPRFWRAELTPSGIFQRNPTVCRAQILKSPHPWLSPASSPDLWVIVLTQHKLFIRWCGSEWGVYLATNILRMKKEARHSRNRLWTVKAVSGEGLQHWAMIAFLWKYQQKSNILGITC